MSGSGKGLVRRAQPLTGSMTYSTIAALQGLVLAPAFRDGRACWRRARHSILSDSGGFSGAVFRPERGTTPTSSPHLASRAERGLAASPRQPVTESRLYLTWQTTACERGR